jgi:hypothetical protein
MGRRITAFISLVTVTFFTTVVVFFLNFITTSEEKEDPESRSFIVEQLAQTGEEKNETDWSSYTSSSYGYTFGYPQDVQVTDSSIGECRGLNCVLVSQQKDVIMIGSLNITTFFSQAVLDFAYDEGLDKSLYKEPQQTTIGGNTYYYIITKEGYVKMLTFDYKYRDDILWVKTDHKVQGALSSYYIKFDTGISKNSISEDNIDDLNHIFETFTF